MDDKKINFRNGIFLVMSVYLVAPEDTKHTTVVLLEHTQQTPRVFKRGATAGLGHSYS